MNMIQKAKQLRLVCGKAFRMEVPKWQDANATDTRLILMAD